MKKRIISLILVLSIILGVAQISYATNIENVISSASVNLEMDYEKEVYTKVFNQSDNSDLSLLAPEGSKVLDTLVVGKSTVVDYLLGDSRYIVEYFPDGTIRKTVKDETNGVINVIEDNANTSKSAYRIEQLSLKDIEKEVFEITDEEAKELMEQMKEGIITEAPMLGAVNSLETKEVIMLDYRDYSSTKPFNAKWQKTYYNIFSRALDDAGFYPYTNCKLYETMDYHVQVKKGTSLFDSGTAVTFIAAVYDIALDSMVSMITGAGILVTAANKISEACKVVDEHSYTYLGGLEATIYDPTEENTYVEVNSDWDEGKISLGFNYDGTYNNLIWVHTNRSTSLDLSLSTFKNDTINIYNNTIDIYGFWRWGIGRLGY